MKLKSLPLDYVIDKSIIVGPPYNRQNIDLILDKSDSICVIDHANGTTVDGRNDIWFYIQDNAKKRGRCIHVYTPCYAWYMFGMDLCERFYPDIVWHDTLPIVLSQLAKPFWSITTHAQVNFENFIVTFAGTAHVSRKLLLAALHKRKWFDQKYSTKNFSVTEDEIDGHIMDIVGPLNRFYCKFFSMNDREFNQNCYSVDYNRFDHEKNFKNLEQRLVKSFVHIASESIGTAGPILSEKSWYSIISRGLYLNFGGQYYNRCMNEFLGFKWYDIFNYEFDDIENPIKRLVALLDMLSKFSNLTVAEWHDLYLTQHDIIEYNYDRFFSKEFIKQYDQKKIQVVPIKLRKCTQQG
jgi:hypothetical protein